MPSMILDRPGLYEAGVDNVEEWQLPGPVDALMGYKNENRDGGDV